MRQIRHLNQPLRSTGFLGATPEEGRTHPAGGAAMPKVVLQPVQVHTGSEDREGRLVLIDSELVAVLVRLDGEEHGALCGTWLLEAGFGCCDDRTRGPFSDLRDAEQWLLEQLASA